MLADNKCRTILLSDVPADEDEFGSHERVADAITDVIISEQGGKVIGLEGNWGSGKSTIINLVRQKLDGLEKSQRSKEYSVLVFNVWAHQGDPLRRTFLETIIKHLQQIKWVDKDKWKKELLRLSKRLREVHERTATKFHLPGILMALLTLLVPIGSILLNSGLGEGGKFLPLNPTDQSDGKVFFGVILTIFPVIALILYILYTLIIKIAQDDTEDWSTKVGKILPQSGSSEIQKDSLESPEPTSVEFAEQFSVLMNEAINTKKRERVLILVLDNLDRVVGNDALAIISTLQTFLHHLDSSNDTWVNKLWVIIPYDRSLESLWPNMKSNGKSLSDAFFNKAFQIRFKVPSLLISNWKSYLRNLLEKAFPDHPKHEFNDVIKLYDLYRLDKQVFPAPRDLKVFVNQIGMLHRQRNDTFPMSHYAYYTLMEVGWDDIKTRSSNDIWKQQIVSVLGSELTLNLSAIEFNVDPSVAQEQLLSPQIERALRLGDAQEFAKLVDTYKEIGFWPIFEAVGFEGWDVESILNASHCLNDDEFKKQLTERQRTILNWSLQGMRAIANRIDVWPSLWEIQAERYISFLNQMNDLNLTTRVITTACNSISKEIEPEFALDEIIPLFRSLKSIDLDEAFSSGINIEDIEHYIDICSMLAYKDADAEFWDRFNNASTNSIDSLILNTIHSGGFDFTKANALHVILKTDDNINWNNIIAGIIKRIQLFERFDAEEINALLTTYWEIKRSDSSTSNQLSDAVVTGSILHHFWNTHTSPQAAALCLFTFTKFNPTCSMVQNNGNSANGHRFIIQNLLPKPDEHPEITHEFVKLIYNFGEVNLLFEIDAKAPNARDFVTHCISKFLHESSEQYVFDTETLIENWSIFRSLSQEDDLNIIVHSTWKFRKLDEVLYSMGFDIEFADLYASVIKATNASDATFNGWCIDALLLTDRVTWQNQMQEEGSLLDLLTEFLDLEVHVGLGVEFQDALGDISEEIITGEYTPSWNIRYWKLLPNALNEEHQLKSLREILISNAKQQNGNISPLFFEIFGNEIADIQILSADNKVVQELFTPVLEMRHPEGLKWIIGLLSKNQEFLDQHKPKYAVENFRDRIKNSLSDPIDDETQKSIEEIATLLGISTKDTANTDSESE